MTEIDVPDWVVEAACAKLAVGMEFEGKWPEDYQDEAGDELREAMRAAITAALGAWVVPACYRLHQPNHSSEWISGVYSGPPFTHKAWSVEQTYTLRQEKPE